MTKPHEEEWKTGEGALSGALYHGDTWIGSFTIAHRARLAVQAPALARRLAARLSGDGVPCVCHLTAPDRCNNCEDRDLLRVIGVLP